MVLRIKKTGKNRILKHFSVLPKHGQNGSKMVLFAFFEKIL